MRLRGHRVLERAVHQRDVAATRGELARAVAVRQVAVADARELREVRGLNSIYHNNCIQTWWVKPNGEAENVEIS